MLFLNLLSNFAIRNENMNQIGQTIIALDLVDSTNNYVANLVKEGTIAHGTVILADEQTNGRGQRGTIWQTSAKKNVILSTFVTFQQLPIEKQSAIHHWVAISICQVLSNYGISANIKWPNDILVENKKIAGVLIENAISSSGIKHAIIGIGLNVNEEEFESDKATSLKQILGSEVEVREVANKLIHYLNSGFSSIVNCDFLTLKTDYLDKLWGLNQTVEFVRNDEVEEGIIVGTSEFGLLEVITSNGKEEFDIKEVKFIL